MNKKKYIIISHTIEIRLDARRVKRCASLFEDQDDDVVSEVSFPFDLLWLLVVLREECCDVEHDLEALVLGEDGVPPCAAACGVQPAAEAPPPAQGDPRPEERQELLVAAGRLRVVVQLVFIAPLTVPLVKDAKLEA